ncbi:hypothetical protein NNJEOMEG_03137 [Fundidesulfovibrio magnetotacticus]|uniref:AAA+ ATPase domain-containing protein n=2 Tax=Fundidesulfovibrio magnetotacticus TaxID=2730080 RepID=A0A6V8LYH3_9BACT|nr:hypothetical protein NNJEOMEG_03137 [Fundidesulfovibrio magnetotacticus]
MITNLKIANYGPIRNLQWENPGPINLVIGENGSGKTFFLKALYTALRSVELFRRGDDRRDINEIIEEKLFWTFQTDKITDIVARDGSGPLKCSMDIDERPFSFSLASEKGKPKLTAKIKSGQRESNSVFLPAKEVLSLFGIILKSREQDKLFGFDDTYLDLVKALQVPTSRGRKYLAFEKSRKGLESMLGGKVKYDQRSTEWLFTKGRIKYNMHATAEGIKKIAILDTLLGNRHLDVNSVIFIDEPESALHPKALTRFLDIIGAIAKLGIQFFIASHSYFVIKKLHLIARERGVSIPVQSIDGKGTWHAYDLLEGMPENPIIDESVRLYEEEVGMAFE